MKYLITGGAGFIGSNFARHLLSRGDEVIVFDNFSRRGSDVNLAALRAQFPGLQSIYGDVARDRHLLEILTNKVDVVFHLAAQVGVPSSIADPRNDFEINALGTLNILEAVRHSPRRPALVYASTNKVYGDLERHIEIDRGGSYMLRGLPFGVDESAPLLPISPYGVSKAAGDAYVTDYARIFGLRTAVIRQSCIYGPGQNGSEEQGWLAWFAIAALDRLPLTLYGDGRQVRDMLYIDDLFSLWDSVTRSIDTVSGAVFNAGGGAERCVAIRDLIPVLEEYLSTTIAVHFAPQRPGDQKVYISDTRKAERELGWRPRIYPLEGLTKTVSWLKEMRQQSSYNTEFRMAG